MNLSRDRPVGTHFLGSWSTLSPDSSGFLYDLTWHEAGESADEGATRHSEQVIFDQLFELIASAETYLVLDFFLINDFAGDPEAAPRALSSELISHIAARKRASPELPILLITDPINTVYGSEFHEGFDTLRELGVSVVETNLSHLNDSNPTYSIFYRTLFGWFGNKRGAGWLPNPFLPGDTVTLRSYLALLNFKANHRKTAVAGRRDQPPIALVTSANPHDASSGHSNVAWRFENEAGFDLLAAEWAVAGFSGFDPPPEWQLAGVPALAEQRWNQQGTIESPPPPGQDSLRVLSEGAIRDALLHAIQETSSEDSIELAMFYFGHREVVDALANAAAQRGVRVRLLLDSNRDAFGREKNGVPNRPAAAELVRRGKGNVTVRWYRTNGEQFHSKLNLVSHGGKKRALLGSANLTRRNIDDLNLECNVEVAMEPGSPRSADLERYFDDLWNSNDHSLPYEAFRDESRLKALQYRFMEATGLSTF